MAIEIHRFKRELENEIKILEKDLQSVGRKNPDNPKDWEPLPGAMDARSADENDVADSIESYEENTAILKELEIRYNGVKSAIQRIGEGTYGICKVCGKEIEEKRLEANAAAETCVAHMK